MFLYIVFLIPLCLARSLFSSINLATQIQTNMDALFEKGIAIPSPETHQEKRNFSGKLLRHFRYA